MAEAAVSSLGALQALVAASGDAEGVQVAVVAPLGKLGDAPAMVNLLSKLVADKHWIVQGIHKIKPLVPVAITIQKASQTVAKLIPNYHPDDDDSIIPRFSARAHEMRHLFNKLRRIARKLERLSRRSLAELRPTLEDLSEDLLEVVKIHKDGVSTRLRVALMEFKLEQCKYYCANDYNMLVLDLGN